MLLRFIIIVEYNMKNEILSCDKHLCPLSDSTEWNKILCSLTNFLGVVCVFENEKNKLMSHNETKFYLVLQIFLR